MPFSSCSKAPLRRLSNLADAHCVVTWPNTPIIPEHMRGETGIYATAEHAYQSLRSMDTATARAFEVDGLVNMNLYRAFPVAQGKTKFRLVDMYERKVKHWVHAKGCSGIVAKMVANLPPAVALSALGLKLRPRSDGDNNDEALPFETQRQIWLEIHRAKFEPDLELLRVLKHTAPAVLVENGRFPHQAQYWSAFIDKTRPDGRVRLIGGNMMGRLLMALRDSL